MPDANAENVVLGYRVSDGLLSLVMIIIWSLNINVYGEWKSNGFGE
jgi:hypothetical protein